MRVLISKAALGWEAAGEEQQRHEGSGCPEAGGGRRHGTALRRSRVAWPGLKLRELCFEVRVGTKVASSRASPAAC